MTKNYKIIDIQHSGNKAEKGLPKVGDKYDRRRGQVVTIDFDEYEPGNILVFNQDTRAFLYTTPFVGITNDEHYIYVETVNSIYVLEEV